MNTVHLALAGNPNSGKTTLFNLLTGARQRVGNYAGVTVERKEGTFSFQNNEVHILDLPGCYSLTSYTPEEVVARDALMTDNVAERPQAVVQVIDATALERSLYLTIQFMELGIPVVLALNMMDDAKRKGLAINSGKLSQLLGVPVVETVARKGVGKKELEEMAIRHALESKEKIKPLVISYSTDLDEALNEMSPLIEEGNFLTDKYPARWTALKYLEGDEELIKKGWKENSKLSNKLEAITGRVRQHCEKTLQTYPEAIIADYRYGYIKGILKQGVLERKILAGHAERIEFSDKLDMVLTHRVLGPLIMLGVLYGVFYATFTIGDIPMGWVEDFFGFVNETASNLLPDGFLKSLVVSGIIDGVGGVMGFVPLIMIMFLALTFLEDAGYMARIAYMLDRVLRIFGLHGCSVMPFLVSGGLPGGCAVPGVMATRTLRSPKEKLATLLTAPFMACGAKVPVFVLLAAAFFPGEEAQVMFLITLGAWAAALLVSLGLRKTLLKGEPTPFVMELPPYRMPTMRGLAIHTWERTWQYIKKAGTVILAISILIWAAMTFPGLPEDQQAAFESQRAQVTATGEAREAELAKIDNLEAEEALRNSIAGRVGTFIEPITHPAGFDWRVNIALLGGIAAKEVIVSSLGTAFSLGDVDPEESESLSDRLAKDPKWNVANALSLIIFVLLYAPCFITVVAMARESSWKWAFFSICFNTVFAYVLAVGIYQATTSVL